MVTPKQAGDMFALMQPAQTLNMTGTPSGTLTLIGYGHGHIGHFLFQDATSGRAYAAAGNPDGNIAIKSAAWSGNIPNSNYPSTQLSDDLTDVVLGNISSLMPAVVGEANSKKDSPYVSITNGPSVKIGLNPNTNPIQITSGFAANLIKNTANGQPTDPNSPAPTGWAKHKKWALPTIIGVALVGLVYGAYMVFKGR